MESTIALLRLLDFQTFDSLWYWMAVMVTYAVASNWLLGVPFDVLFRARKLANPHLADLETLVDVNVRRIVEINAYLGVAITIMVAFSLSVLVVLSLFYGVELAQGLLALAAPLTLIMVMNMRLAHQLDAAPLQGRELVDRLFRVRLWTQIVSMIALFFTAMYGMYVVISSQHFF
ncbi:hypothetical protein AN191_05525 [Loktanella sp. 5RATIMAR09]|uniref:hypothetical protein n=1 Tax=Loktanella sp. 5RATIMAR09 TaxID=1225655 RepID=UPI0007076F7A|nr:hypothetical protein [Loktanella sp. 5RATIMAR09]KQI72488.1 hypothetical protein AN191_05525 [Loktanella sp. 5RATIMAR09]